MSLQRRLAKLEHTRPEPGRDVRELDLPPALIARITVAHEAGTFPASMSLDDLETIMDAADDAAKGVVHQ